MSGNPAPVEGVTPQEAKRLVDEQNALIVDVREPAEWESAHIPGALHLPLMQVPQRADELPRDRPLVMQCHSGGRSLQAAQYLRSRGFRDVVNLEGGIVAWHRTGLPLER